MDEVEACEIINGKAEHRCKRCGNLMIKKLDNNICKECYKEMYEEEKKAREQEELNTYLGMMEEDDE